MDKEFYIFSIETIGKDKWAILWMAMRKENEFTEAVFISNSIINGYSARIRAIYR